MWNGVAVLPSKTNSPPVQTTLSFLLLETTMPPDDQYWFPAKQYGWGWGPPITWQGWVVLLAFAGLLVAGALIVPPRQSLAGFVSYAVVLTVLLVGVCWWKGEPPRWRWGGE